MALAEVHVIAYTQAGVDRAFDLRDGEDFDMTTSPYPMTINSDYVILYFSDPEKTTTWVKMADGYSLEVRERYSEVRQALLPPAHTPTL